MTIKAKNIYESHPARTNPVTELADAFGASLGQRLAGCVQEDGKINVNWMFNVLKKPYEWILISHASFLLTSVSFTRAYSLLTLNTSALSPNVTQRPGSTDKA